MFRFEPQQINIQRIFCVYFSLPVFCGLIYIAFFFLLVLTVFALYYFGNIIE